jgi:hypothetical protein
MASGGERNRVLYFEIVAGVHLFQQATDMAKQHFASLTENVKTLQADLNANVKAKLQELQANYATQADAIEAKILKMYEDWDSAVASTVSKDIAATKQWKDQKLAAIEEVRQAALANQASSPIILSQGANDAQIAEINALYDKQRAEIEQITQARMRDSQAATSANASLQAQLDLQVAKLTELQAKYSMMFAEAEASLASPFQQALTKAAAGIGTVYNGMMTAIPVVGAFALGLTGVYAVLDHLALSAADYAMKIVQLGSVTGLTDNQLNNTYRTLQVYNSLFQYFGLSQEQVNMAFTRFNNTLVNHNALLQGVGINASNLKDMMSQLSEKVNAATNDSEKQAIVLAALGVTGGSVGGSVAGMAEQITAATNIGNAAITAYGNNLQKLGLIFTDAQLKAGAAADAIHGQMTLALQGLERQVGANLWPVMEGIWLMITSGAQGSQGAIESLTNALATGLGTVIGFIYGLLGGSMKELHEAIKGAEANIKTASEAAAAAQNQQTQAIQKTTDEIKTLTEADKDLQAQQTARDRAATIAGQNLAKSIRDQTQAIDDQIKSINDNMANFNAAEDAKVKALENEKTNYEDLNRLQNDLYQSQLAQDQLSLDRLQDVTDRRMKSGESLIDYQRRLNALDLQDKIKADQNKTATYVDTLTQQIDLLKQQTDQQKTDYKTQADAQIDSLNKQKQALQNYLSDRQNAVQNQMNAERDATAAMVQANQDKINQLQSSSSASFDGMASNAQVNATDIAKSMQTALDQIDKSMSASAINVGQAWRKGIADIVSGNTNVFQTAGQIIGSAIMDGMLQAIVGAIPGSTSTGTSWLNGSAELEGLMNIAGAGGTFLQKLMPWTNHADGGVVSQPTQSWLGEYGRPEAVIPLTNSSRAQQIMKDTGLASVAQQGGKGDTNLSVNFSGPVADTLVAGRVMDRLAVAAKRNNLIYGAGL